MVFNFIRAFLNQEKVIRELSNSYPIRIAARFLVRAGFRAKDAIGNSTTTKDLLKRKDIFIDTFKEEFKKGMKK
uniref:N-acetyltransferase n=1 Tax=Parastrongyloides trichosuri TaxID=131310 RepID=A0A0N5A2H4_PARTI